MKLKEGFVLRKVAGENIVLTSGTELNLNMMITLNETGAFLWEKIQDGYEEEEMVSAILKEYAVDEEGARSAVQGFIATLNEHGFLEN